MSFPLWFECIVSDGLTEEAFGPSNLCTESAALGLSRNTVGSLPFLYKFRSVLERTEDLIQPNQSGNKRFNPLEGYFEPKARESRTRHNRPARRWTSRVQMYCSGLDSSRHG